MPLRRILPLLFAGAAALSVLTALAGLDGGVPEAAGMIALLAAAAYVVLFVRRPVARWALSAGIVALAAVPVAGWVVVAADDAAPLAVGGADLGTFFSQRADVLHAGTVLLLIAAAALALGVAALPQFRRPVWLTALTGLVALGPVAAVARGAAGAQRDPLLMNGDSAELFWHLAPGFAATVLAGVALVLAVSRADRWFLLPAGALLLQVTTADRAEEAASMWSLARSFGGRRVETSSAFLAPGMRTDEAFSSTIHIDWGPGALTMVALLLASALLAAGAARTAGTDVMVGQPGELPAAGLGEPPAAGLGEPPAAGPDQPAGETSGPDRPRDA